MRVTQWEDLKESFTFLNSVQLIEIWYQEAYFEFINKKLIINYKYILKNKFFMGCTQSNKRHKNGSN